MDAVFRSGTLLFGKYRIEEVLGREGMCLVLEVTALPLGLPRGERLALKLLVPETATSLSVHARFVREAQSVARLRGEHVARVVDVGVSPDGVPYLAAERLRGADLAGELARRGALAPGPAVDLALQICEALAEGHAHGIVHGDIRPGNLLLIARPDGTPLVKVLGFGASRNPAAATGPLPRPEAAAAAPGYMAPEQRRAAAELDARTDIWALGAVLYECLTGRHPFAAFPASPVGPPSKAARTGAEAPGPPAMDDRVPRELQAIVLQCLEVHREARVPSIAALAAALEPFAQDVRAAALVVDRVNLLSRGVSGASEPAPARGPVVMPPSARSGAPPDRRRRRYATIAMVALVASIGGISAEALIRPGRARRPIEPAAPGVPSRDLIASAAATSPTAAGRGDVEKTQTLARCTELETRRAWQALDACAAELAQLGVADKAERLHATARHERGNELQGDKVRQALRDGNLDGAQATLRQIDPGSVYLAPLRDEFAKAELQRTEDARRKALALASAHDCASLERLIDRLSAAGTERVVAAARSVTCDVRSPPVDRTAARPAAPPSRPPASASPAPPHHGCDGMNVDDVMTRAAIQYDTGSARSALSLTRAALGCKQTDRMYWLAVMYACAAHDLASAKLYFPKIPANLQSGIEHRCQAENLDVRTR